MAKTEAAISPVASSLSWMNWANLFAYIVNFGVTWLSMTGIFGATNAEVSRKYQTLVNPAGWTFSIWGLIFIWEGVFAVMQMFPAYRGSRFIRSVTFWWLSACFFQVAWTPFFDQEVIVASVVCMLGILSSLLGGIFATDSLPDLGVKEWWLLRAPLSLHAGWIVVACVVNINVLADFLLASPGCMLAVAVVSFAVIAGVVAFFACAARKGDPIICLVAAWALAGIYAALLQADYLKDSSQFNYYDWPQVVLDGLRFAALTLSMGSFACAVVAAGRFRGPKLWDGCACRVTNGVASPRGDAEVTV